MIPLFKVLMSPDAKSLVDKVLDSGYTGQGKICEEFESKFQEVAGAPVRPLLVNSCTSALDLANYLIGIENRDVLVTGLSCFATATGIPHRKGKIIWVDVDKHTGLIDVKDVENKITSNTAAIIAVDWGGASCDYDALKTFGVPVIQDAAHSFLGKYKGEPIAKVGGTYICWSFQSIKHLSMADGGALQVPQEQYDRAKLLRWYGLNRDGSESFRCSQDIVEAGMKYQSNDVLAAIGLSNIPLAIQAVEKQRANARFYYQNLKDLDGVILPKYSDDSSWWLYTIVLERVSRDKFMAEMFDRGIATSPVHRRLDEHSCFREFKKGKLDGLDYYSSREVAIPVGFWLSQKDLEYIVKSVRSVVK